MHSDWGTAGHGEGIGETATRVIYQNSSSKKGLKNGILPRKYFLNRVPDNSIPWIMAFHLRQSHF